MKLLIFVQQFFFNAELESSFSVLANFSKLNLGIAKPAIPILQISHSDSFSEKWNWNKRFKYFI